MIAIREAVIIHLAKTNVKLTLEGAGGSELSFFDVSLWQYDNILLRLIVNSLVQRYPFNTCDY